MNVCHTVAGLALLIGGCTSNALHPACDSLQTAQATTATSGPSTQQPPVYEVTLTVESAVSGWVIGHSTPDDPATGPQPFEFTTKGSKPAGGLVQGYELSIAGELRPLG
jgi:hypothetical protein